MSTSRAETTNKKYFGVAEALVTDVNDPEKSGKVKLKFPWFDGNMETEWCRVRQFYAGNDYGAFFIPEVGDEVLVSFIHGDMRYPIILGGLYNGKDKPPSYRTDDKDEKMIRTKGGHQIILDDTSGSEKISIIDANGNNSIVIDTVANSITFKAPNGKLVLEGLSIEMTAQTEVKIKGATVNIN